MRKPKRVTVFITILLASFCCASIKSPVQAATSEDNWPMYHHDPAHTSYAGSSAPATNLTVLWTAYKGVGSSPVVANGYVYIGQGPIRCFNASNGQKIWELIENKANLVADSSPAVYGGYIYTYSGAYNASTGEQFLDYSNFEGLWGSPTVVDDIIYIGSRTSHTFFALDANTGKVIWKFTENSVCSSPAVVNGYVYFTTDSNRVYAFDALNGTQLWKYDLSDRLDASSPAVFDGRVYVGSRDNMYCFDAITGAKLWNNSRIGTTSWSSPAVANGVVYIASLERNLYALNAYTGKQLWSAPVGSRTSPSIAGDIVYVGTSHKIIAFNASTGAQIWNYTYPDAGLTNYQSTSAIVNGVVYASNFDKLYAFGINTTTPTPPPTIEPLLTTWELAAVVSVTVVAVGLVAYFKKRKR